MRAGQCGPGLVQACATVAGAIFCVSSTLRFGRALSSERSFGSAQPQRPQHANRARRRGDRIEMLVAAVHESAIGT
jgi:hypothetical protein